MNCIDSNNKNNNSNIVQVMISIYLLIIEFLYFFEKLQILNRLSTNRDLEWLDFYFEIK